MNPYFAFLILLVFAFFSAFGMVAFAMLVYDIAKNGWNRRENR